MADTPKPLSGLMALFSWMRAHPIWAALVFLVLIPVVFYYLVGSIRSTVLGLPGVGGILKKLPDVGAPAAPGA